MLKCSFLAVALAVLAVGGVAQAQDSFTLSSPEIKQGTLDKRFEYKGFGCSGENKSPALSWKNAPVGTKSFALTVYDKDAPTGSGWWHWVVVNIPASAKELPSGAGAEKSTTLPQGALQLRSDFGSESWGGACPPVGDKPHPYRFTLYALNVDKLDLPQNPTAALAGYMINAHKIGEAHFTATYGR